MATNIGDILMMHRDLKEYYANMGFMETSTPIDLLEKVILPSQTRAIPLLEVELEEQEPQEAQQQPPQEAQQQPPQEAQQEAQQPQQPPQQPQEEEQVNAS